MTDFDYDVWQKKRIARGARNKKIGSKTSYVSLPSDHLSRKEFKNKCGEVYSMNINKPMDWGKFKSLSDNLQEEYLLTLQKRYGATCRQFGEMFGVEPNTVRQHAKRKGFNISFSSHGKLSSKNEKAWYKFVCEDGVSDEELDEIASEPTEEISDIVECLAAMPEKCVALECEIENALTQIDSPEIIVTDAAHKMEMNSMTMNFTGLLNPTQIFNSIKFILGENSVGTLSITYNMA